MLFVVVNTTVLNLLRIALQINLIFLFTGLSRYLQSYSHLSCHYVDCYLMSDLNRPGKHCNSLPVQAKLSTPKLLIVGSLASRFCGIKA